MLREMFVWVVVAPLKRLFRRVIKGKREVYNKEIHDFLESYFRQVIEQKERDGLDCTTSPQTFVWSYEDSDLQCILTVHRISEVSEALREKQGETIQ